MTFWPLSASNSALHRRSLWSRQEQRRNVTLKTSLSRAASERTTYYIFHRSFDPRPSARAHPPGNPGPRHVREIDWAWTRPITARCLSVLASENSDNGACSPTGWDGLSKAIASAIRTKSANVIIPPVVLSFVERCFEVLSLMAVCERPRTGSCCGAVSLTKFTCQIYRLRKKLAVLVAIQSPCQPTKQILVIPELWSIWAMAGAQEATAYPRAEAAISFLSQNCSTSTTGLTLRRSCNSARVKRLIFFWASHSSL